MLDGQELKIPQGVTAISTIVTPSVAGDIEVSSSSSRVQLRLDVRGYVTEAAENVPSLNGPGAYWPSESAKSTRYAATDAKPTPVALGTASGSDYVLALIDATAASALTMVEVGESYQGRARGAVIDSDLGSQPQLALIPAEDGEITLRRGDSEVSVLPLGSILSSSVGTDTGDSSLNITSPASTELDVSDTLAFSFAGTAKTAGTAPLRIEVTLDGEPYGSAAVRAGKNTFNWDFTAAVQQSGDYDFGFTLVDRSGNRTTSKWNGYIGVPSETDTVLTQETVVIGTPGHESTVLAVTDAAVTFEQDPNLIPSEIIISDASSGAPSGFLRRVVAIDLIAGVWTVTTAPATLGEVFLQADYEDQESLVAQAEIDTEPIDPATAEEVTDASIRIVPAGETDVAPFPGDVFTPSGEDGELIVVEPAVSTLNKMAKMAEPAAFETGESLEIKASFKATGTQDANETGGAAEMSVSAEAKAEIALALTVKLKASISWTEASLWPPAPPLPVPTIDHFSSVLKSTAKGEAKISTSIEASFTKEWVGPKQTLKFVPNTFVVGVVPLVFTSDLGVRMVGEFKVSGTANLDYSTSAQFEQELGFKYENGIASAVNPGPKMTVVPWSLDEGTGLTGAVEASVGPELAYTNKLYSMVGAELKFTIKVGTSLTLAVTVEKVSLKAEVFLSLGVELSLKVTVPVINYDLVDVVLLSAEKKWTLSSEVLPFGDVFPDTEPPTGPVPDEDGEIDYGQGELSDASDAVAALDISGATAKAGFFVEGPPNPASAGILSQAVGGFPTVSNDFLVMSTGPASHLFDGASGDYGVKSLRGTSIYDATTLRIDIEVPAGVNCLIGFDFRFYSDEYPEYVGSRYNDAFIAELDKSTWTEENGEISAPRNFAFDELGNPITINAAGLLTMTAANAEGTQYDGATRLLKATTPVTPGAHSLFLSIFDVGDASLDSAVLIDGLTFGAVENTATQCQSGVTIGE
jgi:hypothetical protein